MLNFVCVFCMNSVFNVNTDKPLVALSAYIELKQEEQFIKLLHIAVYKFITHRILHETDSHQQGTCFRISNRCTLITKRGLEFSIHT